MHRIAKSGKPNERQATTVATANKGKRGDQKACVEKQLWMAGKHATGQSRCQMEDDDAGVAYRKRRWSFKKPWRGMSEV